MHDTARTAADMQHLATAIGSRVRHERQARNWTLENLAAAAGLSRRMVINVEHGSVNPSVGTLLRLSDALGIGLPALVEPPRSSSLKITRSGEGAVLWSGELGGRGVLVAGTEPPDVVELWEWSLAPGEFYESEAHTAGTMELLQVSAGRITLHVADDTVTLDTGDAITFRGDVAHSYTNPDPEPVRFTLTVFEPGVGATSHTDSRNRP